MGIKNLEDKVTKLYNSKYEKTITKEMLEKDMYDLKLSQREIAKKYNVGKGTIQNLQNLYKLQILNIFERRVPRSLTYEQKQLILGTVLADGHLFKKTEKSNAALKISHSIKQEAYLDFKYDQLKEFVRTSPTIQVSNIKGYTKNYKCKSFRTLTHDYFTFIYDFFYDENKKKHITKKALEQMGPVALAVAYMDDGTKKSRIPTFCFDCFSQDEQQIFCDWLKEKFNIKATVVLYKSKGVYRTRILNCSHERFFSLIEPFVIESMRYKLQKK